MGKNTKRVMVGGVPLGGGAPVSVQSMTNTDTRDIEATVAQILALESAGCDIVRASVYDKECASAFARIRPRIHIPLVADIHFDYRLAILAMENGADKIRFNPGNIGSEQNVRALVSCAKAHRVPIRVGVNAGSLEKDVLDRFGGPTPEAMLESALKHVRLLEGEGFFEIVLSLKASNVQDTVKAYRLASKEVDYPLHLGVTEAGRSLSGIVKSSVGIGALLLDGIGDTIRVSLTGDPVKEVEAGLWILRAAGVDKGGVEIISCPTCGRCRVDLESAVERVERALPKNGPKIKVAVMGCAVNGPGEAKEADIGIAFGPENAVVFRCGEKAYAGKMPEILDRFVQDAVELAASRKDNL
ncbi:MAG: flavodoxin-dependent (E)-4-hydroxy-3-methylbut-2-enyl-diphosphate synthase [Bacillota bacterium]